MAFTPRKRYARSFAFPVIFFKSVVSRSFASYSYLRAPEEGFSERFGRLIEDDYAHVRAKYSEQSAPVTD